MISYGETTAAEATEAAGVRAVALALLVTVAFSCAFFYMMRWAASASSSERRRRSSRHQRGNVGDGFTSSAKHKKSTSVVRQRKKNNNGGKQVSTRPAPTANNTATASPASGNIHANVGGANIKNSERKKKKAVDDGDVQTGNRGGNHLTKTNETVSVAVPAFITRGSDMATDRNNSSRERSHRNRRQKLQERSDGDSSANSGDNRSSSVIITAGNGDRRRRSSSWSSHSHADEDHLVVDGTILAPNDFWPMDDDDQDEGEWITMTSGNMGTSISTTVNNGATGELNKRKQNHRREDSVTIATSTKLERRRLKHEKELQQEKPQAQDKQHQRRDKQLPQQLPQQRRRDKVLQPQQILVSATNVTAEAPFTPELVPDKQPSQQHLLNHNIKLPNSDIDTAAITIMEKRLQTEHYKELKALRAEHDTTLKQLRAENDNLQIKHMEQLRALKRETAASNRLLSEHYATVESLCADREYQLTELQAKYDALAETLRMERENLRQAEVQVANTSPHNAVAENETIIRGLREENENLRLDHEIAIRGLREEHETAIRGLREENENMCKEHEVAVKNLRTEHDAALKSLQDDHEITVKSLKNQNETATKNLRTEHEIALKSLQTQNETATKILRTEHETALKSLRTQNETATKILRTEHETALKSLRTQNDTAAKDLIVIQETVLKRLQTKQEAMVESMCAKSESQYRASVQLIEADHEAAILRLREENEFLWKENKNLREEMESLSTKHKIIVDSMRTEYEATIKSKQDEYETEAATACHLAHQNAMVVKSLREQHRTEVERLEQQLVEEQQQHNRAIENASQRHTPNSHDSSEANITKVAINDDNEMSEKLRMETQNRKLHRTVEHYKQIIAETEQMLSRLHGHVECEESRWSRHSADLQRQLDEARRQLDERILRESNCRQKGHEDSEDEEDYKVNNDDVEASSVK